MHVLIVGAADEVAQLELDLKCPQDDMDETLRIERQSLERSILFCREDLGL